MQADGRPAFQLNLLALDAQYGNRGLSAMFPAVQPEKRLGKTLHGSGQHRVLAQALRLHQAAYPLVNRCGRLSRSGDKRALQREAERAVRLAPRIGRFVGQLVILCSGKNQGAVLALLGRTPRIRLFVADNRGNIPVVPGEPPRKPGRIASGNGSAVAAVEKHGQVCPAVEGVVKQARKLLVANIPLPLRGVRRDNGLVFSVRLVRAGITHL